jgi:hypothetical protein
MTATQFVLPPTTIAQAMLFSGSRQWKAAEGSYSVVAFLGQDNPPIAVSYDQPIFLTQQDTIPLNYSSFLLGTPATSALGSQPVRLTPTHMSGVIYSGLSASSTLTLNLNFYYETFPSSSTSQLVTLAKPSCVYDPEALGFLSKTLNRLPVGVPAYMNAEGSWFSDIVDTLASFAGPIGAALGGPAGGALGMALGGAGKALSHYLTAPGGFQGPGPNEESARRALTMRAAPALTARQKKAYDSNMRTVNTLRRQGNAAPKKKPAKKKKTPNKPK